MNQFYCYTKCSTCKKAQKYLDERNIPYEIIDIKSAKFTNSDIKNFHQRSGKDIRKLFNTSGNVYKELKLKDKIKDMTIDECYDLLSTNGMLIKRPILVTDYKVYIGFKEDEYGALMNE
ncbi:arsenate reductase family protein [Mycoplasmatota bacterium]|nr:arsenate reductase family protein [Mycoplasmatota bacterium]